MKIKGYEKINMNIISNKQYIPLNNNKNHIIKKINGSFHK